MDAGPNRSIRHLTYPYKIRARVARLRGLSDDGRVMRVLLGGRGMRPVESVEAEQRQLDLIGVGGELQGAPGDTIPRSK